MGIRTALRKAAADLHTEGVNDLETEIESLRQQKAELQKEEDQQQAVADRYKEQIDLAKSRLKAKTQELLDSQSQVPDILRLGNLCTCNTHAHAHTHTHTHTHSPTQYTCTYTHTSSSSRFSRTHDRPSFHLFMCSQHGCASSRARRAW